MDQAIDLGVGFEVAVRPGDVVSAGNIVATVHAADEAGADEAEAAVRLAVRFGSGEDVSLRPLVSHVVAADGTTYEGA